MVGARILCDKHGAGYCHPVSPGVFNAMEEKESNDIVYLILLLEGELEEWLVEWLDERDGKESRKDLIKTLYFSRAIYVKREELGVFPLTGNLSKNKYEYIMTFKDELSIDKACGTYAVCSCCFAEFVSSNSEIIFPYHTEDIPESW
jgi:hypothetical protein